jgi:hypothetical protein
MSEKTDSRHLIASHDLFDALLENAGLKYSPQRFEIFYLHFVQFQKHLLLVADDLLVEQAIARTKL